MHLTTDLLARSDESVRDRAEVPVARGSTLPYAAMMIALTAILVLFLALAARAA